MLQHKGHQGRVRADTQARIHWNERIELNIFAFFTLANGGWLWPQSIRVQGSKAYPDFIGRACNKHIIQAAEEPTKKIPILTA